MENTTLSNLTETVENRHSTVNHSTSNQINHKLLVVEDHPITQQAIKIMLEALDFQADFANNGKEALEKYKKIAYPLILMDLEMPILNGIQASQKIRKLETEKSLKPASIIAITSQHEKKECRKKCLEAGMNEVNGKPNLEKLKSWIKKYMQT
jgi:CheY-like chemotaxis protein